MKRHVTDENATPGTPRSARGTMAVRRPRKSLVVLAGESSAGARAGWALAESLPALGIEALYVGRQENAEAIAAVAAAEKADSIELCLVGCSGVQLLRTLLRELIEVGRRDTSIVVHRVESVTARRQL